MPLSPVTAWYPLLCVRDVAATAQWFRTHFSFEDVFAADWYALLRRSDAPQVQLAFIEHGHHSVPERHRRPAAGVLLSYEVEDVDVEWARLAPMNPNVLVSLRSEKWPQRHFIVEGPEGIMVDVITPIEPSPDWLAAFANS